MSEQASEQEYGSIPDPEDDVFDMIALMDYFQDGLEQEPAEGRVNEFRRKLRNGALLAYRGVRCNVRPEKVIQEARERREMKESGVYKRSPAVEAPSSVRKNVRKTIWSALSQLVSR